MKKSRGFTLIELLIVTVVIAISVTRTALTIMSSMSMKPRLVMRPLPKQTR